MNTLRALLTHLGTLFTPPAPRRRRVIRPTPDGFARDRQNLTRDQQAIARDFERVLGPRRR